MRGAQPAPTNAPPGWCEAKWATFNGNGVSGGTIFALAEQHGYVRPAKASKERPKATHHLNGSAQLPREESAQPRTNGKANRIEGLEFDDEIAGSKHGRGCVARAFVLLHSAWRQTHSD